MGAAGIATVTAAAGPTPKCGDDAVPASPQLSAVARPSDGVLSLAKPAPDTALESSVQGPPRQSRFDPAVEVAPQSVVAVAARLLLVADQLGAGVQGDGQPLVPLVKPRRTGHRPTVGGGGGVVLAYAAGPTGRSGPRAGRLGSQSLGAIVGAPAVPGWDPQAARANPRRAVIARPAANPSVRVEPSGGSNPVLIDSPKCERSRSEARTGPTARSAAGAACLMGSGTVLSATAQAVLLVAFCRVGGTYPGSRVR